MAHVETQHGLRGDERRDIEFAAGSGLGEAIAAIAGIVLAIVGLAGALPLYMLPISCIALGAALLLEGSAVAARFSRVLAEHADTNDTVEVGGGIAAEALAGVAGIALGILALLGIAPVPLTAVAAIAFGVGLLIGSGSTSRLNSLRTTSYTTSDTVKRVAREAVFVSAGGQVLVGIGAVVLGILALIGVDALVLTLAAMLIVGGSVLLSGTAIGAKMLSVLHG